MTIVLHACFLVSGAAGLALEMLWMRSAALAFGATAVTGASVLGCYFAGLAVGALVASRGSRDPVRDYGRLEIGVALGAAWSSAVLHGVAGSSRGAAHPLLVLAAALLPATICLGATLPILGGVRSRATPSADAVASCTRSTPSVPCSARLPRASACRPRSACVRATRSRSSRAPGPA